VAPLGELSDELRQHPYPWSTVDHGVAQSTDPWTRSTDFLLLLKNISFSIIFREIYTEAPEFRSNYNLAPSFGFYIISNPWNLHFSP
jgi:hypothetical protein